MTFRTGFAERGNILFLILLAVFLMGLITWILAEPSEQSMSLTEKAVLDNDISLLLRQGAALSGALQQMVVNGAAPETLYTTLNTVEPGSGTWDTAPHDTKIYHPYGGGVEYMYNVGTTAVWLQINKAAIITGVGPTDATVGDIVFAAPIASAAACARLNRKLHGSAFTMPTLSNVSFTNLFGGVAVTVSGANCALCVNLSRACVQNTAGTNWGYYQVLFPG